MNEESKKIWKDYLTEYVKDNYDVTYNKYITTKDLNSNIIIDKYNKYYDKDDYKFNIIDYTQKLKDKNEDSKVKNEKILESIPIAEIEKFLRKKKLEKIKSIEK